jgi:hypothetical protein
MRGVVKVLMGALLLMPALSFASGADGSSHEVTHLMTWTQGVWGVGAAVAVMLLGAIAGVPVGTPMPPVEGIVLAAALNWLPGMFASMGAPFFVQNIVAMLLFAWLASFVTVFVGFLTSGRWGQLGQFSFIALASFARKTRRGVQRAAPARTH